MLEKDIAAREAELRRNFPHSFNHPGLMKGEMCAGLFISDDGPELIVSSLRASGLHARLGALEFGRGVCSRPIFVNIREQILIEGRSRRMQAVG